MSEELEQQLRELRAECDAWIAACNAYEMGAMGTGDKLISKARQMRAKSKLVSAEHAFPGDRANDPIGQ